MSETLIDIGANLTHESFSSDLDQVLARAKDSGVAFLIVTGSSALESERAAALAESYPDLLRATAGIHPHEAKSFDNTTIQRLRDCARSPFTVSLGECGLDFFRDISPRTVQMDCFEAQLELAAELQLPLFIHERDAADEMQNVLMRYRHRLNRVVIHCFTGDRRALIGYLDMDLHIGITGWICDERRGGHLHDIVGLIPANRLMVETDSPYLMPRTIKPRPKSRRNEPCNLPYVVATLAHCLGIRAETVAARTTSTASEFFALGDTLLCT